jgi:hypothetical protein
MGYRARMMKPDDRARILFDLAMALRGVPRGSLRDLAKPRRPGDDLAERAICEAVLAHLELCGWGLEHRASPTVTPAR